MRRIFVAAVAALFVGMTLAGCVGGNDQNDGTGGAAPPQTTVRASPLTPAAGESVTFEATGAKEGDEVSWDFGDGSKGEGLSTTHAYTAPGSYIALLTVKRGERSYTNDAALTYISVSAKQTDLANVSESTAPKLDASASSQVVQKGTEVRFAATGGAWVANPDFDPENPVQNAGSGNEPFKPTGDVNITWDFGDGTTVENKTANHTYDEAGVYAAKATATSTTGATAEYVLTIRVLPEAPAGTNTPRPNTYLHATIGEPESLDPAYDYETSGGTILQQVYERLVDYQRDSAEKLRPVLASEMPTASDDGLTYTVKVRPNVKFHDGTTLDGDDIKYSLDRLVMLNDPHSPAWIYEPIKGAGAYFASGMGAADRTAYLDAGGVKVSDDKMTVTITLDYADPAFLYRLAFNAASIVSKEAFCASPGVETGTCLPAPGQTRHPWADQNVVGTGPYQLERWQPGQMVILKRFDGYWGPKPQMEKVIVQKVDDINTRLLMLFSGQADSVYVPVDHDTDVEGKAGVRIVENPSWTVSFLGMNQKFCRGPDDPGFQSCMQQHGDAVPKGADGQSDPLFFNDIEMRKAWTLAFDYDTYYNDILKEHGRMLNGPLPKGIFGYDESIPQPKQDLAAAKEALAKTEHADGFTITVYFNSGNTVREKTAFLLKQNIESLGPNIRVNVQGLDWSTAFLPKQRAAAMPVFYLGWAPDYAFPDNYVVTFAHSEKGIYSKRIGYVNETLDEKLDTLLKTTDEAELKQGYSDAVKSINDDYVFIWLGQSANYAVHRDWVTGYYYNPMHSGTNGIGDYAAIGKS